MRRFTKIKGEFLHIFFGSLESAKGFISLFLAIVITPILGLTCLLVESIRYQDIIEGMLEVDDLSAFAALGNYDKFIKERFGLLTVAQKEELLTLYNKYYNENSAMYQKDISVVSMNITGEYPLTDMDVFEQQLMDYCELSSLVQVLCEGLDISEIIKKIEKTMNIDPNDKKSNLFDTATKWADVGCVADRVAKIYGEIQEAKELYANYQLYEQDYKNKYYNADYDYGFESSAKDYRDALKAAQDSGLTGDAIYSDETAANAYDNLAKDFWDSQLGWIESQKTVYKNAAHNYKNNISTMTSKISDIAIDCDKLLEEIEQLKKDDEKGKTQDYQSIEIDIYLGMADIAMDLINQQAQLGIKDKEQAKIAEFDNLEGRLRDMNNKSITPSTTDYQIKSTYYVEPATYFDTYMTILDGDLAAIDQLFGNDDSSASIEDMIDMVYSLMDINFLYDPALDSVVDRSYEYDPDLGAQAGVVAIGALLDAVDGIANCSNALEFILAVVEAIAAMFAFIGACVVWLARNLCAIVSGAIETLLEPSSLAYDIIVCGYAAYNFPNRLDYDSPYGLPLSGYKYYNNIYVQVAGGTNVAATLSETCGSISTCVDNIFGDPEPNNIIFKACEAEYLLCGFNNDYENQIAALFDIYMMRFCLNIGPMFLDSEVKGFASCAGQFAPLLIILMCIGESLIDAFILANGGFEYMLKDTIYLTGSGLPYLLYDLFHLSKLADVSGVVNSADKMAGGTLTGTSVGPDYSEKKGAIPLKMTYSEHLFWLMFLGQDRRVLLARMQNLVKMNAYAYHSKIDSYEYDFEKSYTFIKSDIVYTINPMFDFGALSSGESWGSYQIKQSRYNGY